jgi:cytidylate kinase
MALTRSTICISQTTGSGGPEIGRSVSERLGFRHVDEEIVEWAAEREKIEPGEIADVERRQTFVRRFMQSIEQRAKFETFARTAWFPDPDAEQAAPARPLVTSDDLRDAIRVVIRETAEQGNVVIVSHGASIALAGAPGVLRVLLTASPETRAERYGEGKLEANKALKAVRETDRAREDYLWRFYGVRHEEPTHYDLVINTDVLGYDEAADLIVAAAQGPRS